MRLTEKEFIPYSQIEVSRSAILHNIDLFHQLTGKDVIPVLKGNAYGHGIELVAGILEGRKVPYIAVVNYNEALRIRTVSSQPVLIMGAILPADYSQLEYDNFAFVVDNEAAIKALGETSKPVKIHLECNSGMNRYGAEPDDMSRLATLILSYANLELEGVMSHLADSDGHDSRTVDEAVGIFDACVEQVKAAGAQPTLFHVAQTAGSLTAKSKYANSIRIGIGAYGINPFSPAHSLYKNLQNELRPALKLTSTITRVRELETGDKVSYNYTFVAPHKMKIGVIPVGYYEGVNRELSNVGTVKIGESFVPIVGRVCMNHTIIDLTNADAQTGSQVVVFSSDPNDKNSIDNIANEYELFDYSLLTALNVDIHRILIE